MIRRFFMIAGCMCAAFVTCQADAQPSLMLSYATEVEDKTISQGELVKRLQTMLGKKVDEATLRSEPIQIDLYAGGGKIRIDLRGFNVQSLRADAMSADIQIQLPLQQPITGYIITSNGNVELITDGQCAVTVDVERAEGDAQVRYEDNALQDGKTVHQFRAVLEGGDIQVVR